MGTHVSTATRLEPVAQAAPLPRAAGLDPDRADSAFDLLADGEAIGLRGALITLVELVGGGPRALGTQMAVLEDGRYCGRLSGGCIEGIIATEAAKAIAVGRHARLRLGRGSRFLDVELPCGGAILLDIRVGLPASLCSEVRRRLAQRECFSLLLADDGAVRLRGSGLRDASGSCAGGFVRHYHPRTRIAALGRCYELQVLENICGASGIAFDHLEPTDAHAAAGVDPYTAVVLMLHDRFSEVPLLEWMLSLDAPFYLGVLGSARTHEARLGRLRQAGLPESLLARLRGPIGLFGPTRDATSLAVSVLAEVTQARQNLDGSGW